MPEPTGRANCPVATAKALLRKARLRATAQRCGVAWLLTGRGVRHVTADGLHAEARQAKIDVSLSTVYNILKRFTDVGILRQRTFPDGTVVYDTDVGDHHHFLDEETGEIVDMDGPAVSLGELPPIPDGFMLDGVDLVVSIRKKGQPAEHESGVDGASAGRRTTTDIPFEAR